MTTTIFDLMSGEPEGGYRSSLTHNDVAKIREKFKRQSEEYEKSHGVFLSEERKKALK